MIKRKVIDLLVDALTYGLSNVLAQLIGFFLLPLYTHYLSPEDYGVTAMLTIISLLFTPLARLGMTNAIFRRFNTSKNDQERSIVLSTGLASVVLSSLSFMLLFLLLSAELTTLILGKLDYQFLVQLTLVSAAINTMGDAPIVILRANREAKIVAAMNTMKVFVTILATIVSVVWLKLGVLGIVLGILIANIIFAFVPFYLTRRYFRFVLDGPTWKVMATYGIPFVPHHLQGVGLNMMSQYMVSHVMGLSAAGLYNVAIRLAVPLSTVANAIQQAWVPFKFKIHAEDKNASEIFRTITTYYLALVLYLWVGSALWGPEVLRWMTASAFHDAAYLVPVVTFIPVSQGIYWMIGPGFELGNSTAKVPLISLAGLVAVFASCFILVPLWGGVGAALTSILGWLVMAVMVYRLAKHVFDVQQSWLLISFFLILSISIVAGGYFFQQSSISFRLIYAAAGSLTYPAIAFLALLGSETERHRAKNLIAHLRKLTKLKAA